MDVGIIGAGSIGMLFGSHIAASGLSVTMLVRQKAQQEALNAYGICRVNENGSKIATPIRATTDYINIAQAKVIIIAVKYKDLAAVLTALREHDIKAPLLFIQNGIGHLQDVGEDDFPNVAFATVEHGALKQSEYIVKHNGVGATTIGIGHGSREKFECLHKANKQAFPIDWHEDVEHILLRKAFINCLINPLTTILSISNGLLVENPNSHQLMSNLYDELMTVFPEMRSALPLEAVEGVCKNTSENTSSMLADYQSGRPMEIETIVSAVIHRAEEKGKALPLLKTYEQLLIVLDRKARVES